jgi:hypothetical protein
MKVYQIYFTGFYPIGAVALASGNDLKEAINTLWNSPEFEPHRKANSMDDLYERSSNGVIIGLICKES